MAGKMNVSSEQFEYLWQNLSDDSGNLGDFSAEFDLNQLAGEESVYKPQLPSGVNDLYEPIVNDDSGLSTSTSSESSPDSSPVHPSSSAMLEPSAQSLPSTTPYTGPYGFSIGFEHQPKDTKATMWTYSPSLHKFFVRMSAACPIRFQTEMPLPQGCIIRGMMVYSKPEHVQEPVRRCPNHTSDNDGHPAPAHLLRCQHQQTTYTSHPITQRHSLIIPAEAPQPGATHVTNLFQFMCFSSCVGGLNRRPVTAVFTLESQDGQVLGRQSVEVRICACPGRDRKQEERPLQPEQPAPKPMKRKNVGCPLTTPSNPAFDFLPEAKKIKQETDEVFTLTVVGLHNFQILSQIRDSLELASMIPGMQIQQYKQQQQPAAVAAAPQQPQQLQQQIIPQPVMPIMHQNQ